MPLTEKQWTTLAGELQRAWHTLLLNGPTTTRTTPV
jgi:hypothetical protein